MPGSRLPCGPPKRCGSPQKKEEILLFVVTRAAHDVQRPSIRAFGKKTLPPPWILTISETDATFFLSMGRFLLRVEKVSKTGGEREKF